MEGVFIEYAFDMLECEGDPNLELGRTDMGHLQSVAPDAPVVPWGTDGDAATSIDASVAPDAAVAPWDAATPVDAAVTPWGTDGDAVTSIDASVAPDTPVAPWDETVAPDAPVAPWGTDGDSVTAVEPIGIPRAAPEDAAMHVPNKRPRRAAAILADKRVHEVLKWEKCKESSSMFKNAAMQINEEFDRAGRGGRQRAAPAVVADDSSPVESSVVSREPTPVPVIEIASDDEGVADVDCPDVDTNNDNEDDFENDEDESGSLASFVVSDSHMSQAGDISDAESVDDDSGSGSASDSDSCSDFSCTETDSDDGTTEQRRWGDNDENQAQS
jgi:hypothetical protein